MEDINRDCKMILKHIKKCINAMDFDGYTDAGIIGYFIKLPFKRIHMNHFKEVEYYTKRIIKYTEENNIDIKIDRFEEYVNSSILYNASQISILAYKQYEYKSKYLEELRKSVNTLLDIINKESI